MSKPEKNPRADAKLKRLPEEVQAHIVELCGTPNVTQKHILDWIEQECDVRSSPAALSEFLSWYAARQRALHREQRVSVFLSDERDLHPELSDEELFRRGQRLMTLLTISEEDPQAWAKVQRTARDREDSELQRQKFQRETVGLFLKWYADRKAKEIAESPTLSHQDKIETLGQQMFGELW